MNFETSHDTQTDGSDSSFVEEDDDTSSKASKSSEKTFQSVRKCKSHSILSTSFTGNKGAQEQKNPLSQHTHHMYSNLDMQS